MKKFSAMVMMIIAATFCMISVGCENGSSASVTSSSSVQKTEEQIAEEQAQESQKIAEKTLIIDEPKVTEDYELTVTRASWQDEVYPFPSDYGYSYLSDVDGNSYYVVEFSFHNLMDSFYEFSTQFGTETVDAKIKFNNTYQYPMSLYDPSVDSLFSSGISYSIGPFESKTYYLVANVSDEIRNSFEGADMVFAFKKIFTDGDGFIVLKSNLGDYIAHFQ